jgi:hypothetical protein
MALYVSLGHRTVSVKRHRPEARIISFLLIAPKFRKERSLAGLDRSGNNRVYPTLTCVHGEFHIDHRYSSGLTNSAGASSRYSNFFIYQ